MIALQRLLLIALACACYYATGILAFECLQIARLESVEGTVNAAKIEPVDMRRGGFRYRPVIEYSYSVGGRDFSNDLYSMIFIDNVDEKKWAEAVVRDFPAGAACTVYYDPRNPQVSCLSNRFRKGAIWGTAFMAIFGTCCLVIGVRRPRRPVESFAPPVA